VFENQHIVPHSVIGLGGDEVKANPNLYFAVAPDPNYGLVYDPKRAETEVTRFSLYSLATYLNILFKTKKGTGWLKCCLRVLHRVGYYHRSIIVSHQTGYEESCQVCGGL